MTVKTLRDSMDQGEFMRWYIYHARRSQETELAHARTR